MAEPRWRLIAALVVACAADAAEVRVRVDVSGPASDCLRSARLMATDGTRTVEVPLSETEPAHVLALPDDRNDWRISVRREGCWSEVVRPDRADPLIRLYRAGTMHGTFAGGRVTQSALRAQVFLHTEGTSPRRSEALAISSDSNAECAVSGTSWRCAVPAGVPFDLRLDIPRFASAYYWDTVVAADAVASVAPAILRPGGSVAGWVSTPGDEPLAGARVTAFPLSDIAAPEPVPARLRTTRSDARGFFQITGIEPGHYRIVSEASELSPVAVDDVEVAAADEVKIPRVLRHAPLAELELVVQPPTDRGGGNWAVTLEEIAPLFGSRRSASVRRRVSDDGTGTFQKLRADAYEVVVEDPGGVVVHRGRVELVAGRNVASVNVNVIVVRGVVLAGDEGVECDIEFTDRAGGQVRGSTDASGRFELAFPKAGTWEPTVLYPRGRRAAYISAAPVKIVPEEPAAAPQEIEVRLVGGRLSGQVVNEHRKPGEAAVHAFHNGRIAAQQITGADGKFDLIGLAAGTYVVDAQNREGSTPAAVEVQLGRDEHRELELVTAPYRRVSISVVTPDGRPATGAIVHLSSDGGATWTDTVTDVRGQTEAAVRAGTAELQLVAATYDYPAAVVAAPLTGRPVQIQLRRDGGWIRFGNRRVAITSKGIRAPAAAFYFPPPLGRFGGAIYVESGAYAVCLRPARPDGCREVVVEPGAYREIEFDAPSAGATP